MSFGAYSGSLTISSSYNPEAAAISSSLDFPPPQVNNTINAKSAHTLGSGANGINEEAVSILTIAASGSATLNLQSLTDVLGTAAVALTKLKKYLFWLLTAADDTVNGTACSSVTIQGGATNPHTLNLGGTTPTATLYGSSTTVGDKMGWATNSANGITVSPTACNVKVANNDGTNAAAVLYDVGGA